MSSKEIKPLRQLRRKVLRIVRWTWLPLLALIFLGGSQIALNKPRYQKACVHLAERFNIARIEFNNLEITPLLGRVRGKALSLWLPSGLHLNLEEFNLQISLQHLLIGRIKIDAIQAQKVNLDTAAIAPKEPGERRGLPRFLTHLELRLAKIQAFVWDQGAKGRLTVGAINLSGTSSGRWLSGSELTLSIHHIFYRGARVDGFVDRFQQIGDFTFDFSQPRILDESQFAVKAHASGILIAFNRKPKPWLTDSVWDADLEGLLHDSYGGPAPFNRTYLPIQRFSVSAEKNGDDLSVNDLKISISGGLISGSSFWRTSSHQVSISLKTDRPLPVSKLPLGQAKFRQAFAGIGARLSLSGIFENLDHHDLMIGLSGELTGNAAFPEIGDVSVELGGKIRDRHFDVKAIKASLGNGTATASGQIDLKALTAKLNANFNAFDAGTVVRMFSSVNIPCLANGTGNLTGSLKSPKVSLSLNSPDAAYEFLRFGPAKASLNIANNTLILKADSTDVNRGLSSIILKADEVFTPVTQSMSLTVSNRDVPIQPLLKSKSMTGTISGELKLTRKQGYASADGNYTANDFHFYNQLVGKITSDVHLRGKHLDIKPLVVDLADPKTTLTARDGMVFDFNDFGYTFSGTPIRELKIAGHFEKISRDHVHIDAKADNMPLTLFGSLIPFAPDKSRLSGDVAVDYNIPRPEYSRATGAVRSLSLILPEGEIKLGKASRFAFQDRAFIFQGWDVIMGTGRFNLDGPLGLTDNTALKIKGPVDLNPISDIDPWLSESDGITQTDLKISGDLRNPLINGKIDLRDVSFVMRKFPVEITNATGVIQADGKTFSSNNFKLSYDEAPIALSGKITTDWQKITGADLNITGKEVPFTTQSGMVLQNDIALKLKGSGHLNLSGTINIVDGRYTRNLGLSNFILKPQISEDQDETRFSSLSEDTSLDFKVRNTGDLMIKNNIANIELNADLNINGTLGKPALSGQVNFLGGTVHAFGVDFEDATGYALFNKDVNFDPDINVTASKSVQEYEVAARMSGKLSNLKLRLESTPSLERRDILSLLFYGVPSDQLTNDKRQQFTRTAAISQLASVLSGPIQKISGLDVVEVNSRQQSANESIQRLSIGKSLSKRINLAFTADLGVSNPERGFELAYQLFDSFNLIAAKDFGERYRFDVNFRFDSY